MLADAACSMSCGGLQQPARPHRRRHCCCAATKSRLACMLWKGSNGSQKLCAAAVTGPTAAAGAAAAAAAAAAAHQRRHVVVPATCKKWLHLPCNMLKCTIDGQCKAPRYHPRLMTQALCVCCCRGDQHPRGTLQRGGTAHLHRRWRLAAVVPQALLPAQEALVGCAGLSRASPCVLARCTMQAVR